VRPYGEAKDSAFDWLGLGSRKAKSPATPSKPSGGWHFLIFFLPICQHLFLQNHQNAGHHKKVSFLWQELPYQLQVCFEFTFYFMKRTYSNPDLEKFHYNKFNANAPY
jgi:hypothetical protein